MTFAQSGPASTGKTDLSPGVQAVAHCPLDCHPEDAGPWRPAWSFPNGDLRLVEDQTYPDARSAQARAQEILEAGFAGLNHQPKEESEAVTGTVTDHNEDAVRALWAQSVERDLGVLAREIHEQNLAAGWWDQWLDNKRDRHATAMMLVISEMSEAMEGVRKDLMDDHLTHRKMFDVELADAMIRLLDLAGAYETRLTTAGALAVELNGELTDLTPPEQLFFVIQVGLLCETENNQVLAMTGGVLGIALQNQIDLFPIIAEKRAYNAQRADHKRENRAAPGGKAF